MPDVVISVKMAKRLAFYARRQADMKTSFVGGWWHSQEMIKARKPYGDAEELDQLIKEVGDEGE